MEVEAKMVPDYSQIKTVAVKSIEMSRLGQGFSKRFRIQVGPDDLPEPGPGVVKTDDGYVLIGPACLDIKIYGIDDFLFPFIRLQL